MSDWQPITTAPKEGIIVVGPADDGYVWTTAMWDTSVRFGLEGWFSDGLYMEPQPTHWHPIGDLPVPALVS